jgi:outer membrane protein assembly factor BamD (BamD/ComL family)
LSILKSSTTELIANDALYLAVFIQENNTETLKTALKEISTAELLFYQNKPNQAFNLLLSVKTMFPNSSLIDDVLLIEANYALKNKNYLEAISKFKEIVEKHPKSIIADKALYEWSIIEEEQNNNTKLALENYLTLLKNYKDSVYSTDARKRLRALRGDKLEEEM